MSFIASQYCDPVQGLSCDGSTGVCSGACGLDALEVRTTGCDFWVVESPSDEGRYELAVTNIGTAPASVVVEQGGQQLFAWTIPAGQSIQQDLETYQDVHDADGPSAIHQDLGIRVRGDQPLHVVQFAGYDYSADSSLVHPVHAWGTSALVASYLGYGTIPANFAVSVAQAGTVVAVTPSATTGTADAGGGLGADGAGSFTIDPGDVFLAFYVNPSDPTGSQVVGDAPVQVLNGAKCAEVPDGSSEYCDHLEEISLPMSVLGESYVAVPPLTLEGLDSWVRWRVIAATDRVDVTFEPMVESPTTLEGVGDYVEVDTDEAFLAQADGPVMVVGYLYGISSDPGDGPDPSLLVLAPTDRFLDASWLYASGNESFDALGVVIAAEGADATVDGEAVGSLTPIGQSGWGYARIELEPGVAVPLSALGGVWGHSVGLQYRSSYWHSADFSLESR
jgi:hypothetical protein